MEHVILKVSSKSDAHKLAGAIAHNIRETGKVEVSAIGAAALNQAVKGIAIARGYVAPNAIDLILTPGFSELHLAQADGTTVERTAIRLVVEGR